MVVNDSQSSDSEGRPPHCFEAFVSPVTGQNLGQEVEILFASEPQEGDVLSVTIDGDTLGQVTAVADVSLTLELLCNLLKSSSLILDARAVSNTLVEVYSASSTTYSLEVTSANGIEITESVVSPPSGLIDRIAQSLWDSKAAGINTFGEITGQAVDVDGKTHLINFSTIAALPVYVRYTLTVNSVSEYDTSITESIKNAVAAYSQLNFTAGVDVLNYELVCVASDLGLNNKGVTRILVETSIDNVSFNTDNVPVGVEEFALIEAQNVTVNVSE